TVDVQAGLFEPQLFEIHVEQADDFHVDLRPGSAERFHAELVEFPVAPLLDIFVPVGRYVIIELDWLRQRIHSVFDIAAHNAGCSLRTERDAPSSLVVEGVHFLLDYIGSIPDTSLEQFRIFKYRYPYLLVSEAFTDPGEYPADILPPVYLGRKYVACSLWRLDFHGYLPLCGVS